MKTPILTVQEKISLLEDSVSFMIKEIEQNSPIYICNIITFVAFGEKYFECYQENNFLIVNFSELCTIAEKYKKCRYKKDTIFIFNGKTWFDAWKYRKLKIRILKELIELYKSQIN